MDGAFHGKRGARRARGFTLIEMVFSLGIFAVVMLVIYGAADQIMAFHSTGQTALGLEEAGREALNEMTKELRSAGITDHPSYPGNPLYAYPYVWTGNSPTGPYAASYMLDAGEEPLDTIDAFDPADPATGQSCGIVFKTPVTDGSTLLDDAGNPIPVVQSGSEIEANWGGRVRPDHAMSPNGLLTDGLTNNEIAYVLVRDPDGGNFNILQRRESTTGETEELCRYVERVAFEYYLLGGVEQQNQLRIRLYLRRRDDQGQWMEADLSAVVAMRSIRGE